MGLLKNQSSNSIRALSVHSKSPLSSGLYSVGGVNQPVGFDFANCMRLQHNYWLSAQPVGTTRVRNNKSE